MMAKREIPLKVPPDLKIGGSEVESITLTFMSAEELFAEKEVRRQKFYEDMERLPPEEFNDRYGIDWSGVKVNTGVPDDYDWADTEDYEWDNREDE